MLVSIHSCKVAPQLARMLLLRENARVTLHVVGHDAFFAKGLEGTKRALFLFHCPPQLLTQLRRGVFGRRRNDHFAGLVTYRPGGCQAMSVISVNVMPFLVVCCKPFADGVCVGTQSAFEEVVFANARAALGQCPVMWLPSGSSPGVWSWGAEHRGALGSSLSPTPEQWGVSKKMQPSDSRQVLKGALLCSLLAALLLQGGPRMLVVMKKGCHTAPSRDLSGISHGPYLPNYYHVRSCNVSRCNHRYRDTSRIPAFPTVPPDNTSSSLLCYTCIGTTPESCSLRRAEQSQCHDDNPLCYEGTGTATIEDFVVPIYLRSCQAQGCSSVTPGDPWLNIQLEKTSCCAQPLCNHAPELAPTASPRPSRTAPTLDHPTNASPWPELSLPRLLLGGLGLIWDQGRGWRCPL
uniref:UPAR/Ly6 domain-containing protein n=1 Tax=Gopherus agassizii TaxID=38772 RepID=A0A452GG30_9SAUR